MVFIVAKLIDGTVGYKPWVYYPRVSIANEVAKEASKDGVNYLVINKIKGKKPKFLNRYYKGRLIDNHLSKRDVGIYMGYIREEYR